MDELHTTASSSWTHNQIQSRVRDLGEWFHNLNLRGIQTAPEHFLGDYPNVKWERFSHALPSDLHGKSVLDIGCNAGFYSLEMKRRGAERVVGIDSDSRYLAQAAFAAEISELEIEFHCLSIYDVAELHEKFDVVLFLGVLYHLRHPLLALDLLRQYVVRDLLVVQSMLRGSGYVSQVNPDYPFEETAVFQQRGFPKMCFIENKYCGDETNWWIPNNSCLEAMLRSAGFKILDHPEAEIYLCAPSASETHPSPIRHPVALATAKPLSRNSLTGKRQHD
jgi:tRNA (mo5U34)-methyltransferase